MACESQFFLCLGDIHQVVYDQDRGESVCGRCGLVLEERKIETVALPVRRFGSVGKRLFAGGAPISRLRGSNSRNVRGNLRKLLEERRHPLRVQEKAVELFKSVHSLGIVNGRDASIVAKTLLYTSYRLCHVPVALSELTVSQKERKSILRCYKKICRRLESRVPRLGYKDYLSILVRKMRVSRETEVLAIRVLSVVVETRLLGGANPAGVAATALYFSGVLNGRRITQKDVAVSAGVSEVTIRANLRIIRGHPEFQRCLCERRV